MRKRNMLLVVLLIVPSSETKRPAAASGPPVELERLSFPELLPTRLRVTQALAETSRDLDAFERLGVRHTLAAEVLANTRLFDVPAMPVLDLYTGPFHRGLGAASLSAAAGRRAGAGVVVVSAVWGALRPADGIPSGEEPEDISALADVLADRWPVRPQAPERRTRPWTIVLSSEE